MYQTIVASEIRRRFNSELSPGKKCFIEVNGVQTIEMVYCNAKGAAVGYVWFFICPVTGKRCRKLILLDGMYVHNSKAKSYYRDIRPPWITGNPFDKIL